MAEFEIDGVQYRSGKMDVFKQFHVMRKLAPIIMSIGPDFIQQTPQVDDTVREGEAVLGMLATRLAPALDALSTMSEEDCNYILKACLELVQRQDSGVWANVWNKPAQRMQYELDLPTMLGIAVNVLGDNLANFSTGGAQSSPAPLPNQGTPSNGSALPTMKIG